MKKRIQIVVLTLLNLLLFSGTLFCLIRDRQTVDSISAAQEIFSYRTEQTDLLLDLPSGQEIRLRFGEQKVTVYDSHRITAQKEKLYLICFIRTYYAPFLNTFKGTRCRSPPSQFGLSKIQIDLEVKR